MLQIRQERITRGWSQAQLARRARISVSDMSRIEGGWLKPYPQQLKRLARALGWPLDESDRLLCEARPDATSDVGEIAKTQNVPVFTANKRLRRGKGKRRRVVSPNGAKESDRCAE